MKKEIYSWAPAYSSAVLEPNPTQLSIRINTAQSAIDERLRQPIQIKGREFRAIEAARGGLAELEAERVERDGILKEEPNDRHHKEV
jgi:hypothetical protein